MAKEAIPSTISADSPELTTTDVDQQDDFRYARLSPAAQSIIHSVVWGTPAEHYLRQVNEDPNGPN